MVDAVPQLALLGLLTGVVTSGVILGFRSLIDGTLNQFGIGPENFESLTLLNRILMVMSGSVLLAILLDRYRPSARRVGVVHVMERLSRHQGYLPLKNALIQFIGGSIALISGQSGGREGPAIHLGAATASLIGQASRLPNNSVRTMVACGTAAAIASSFNTPIAGVIFAMEVVMMEYTIASFIPVIVASVSATLITQLVYGAEPAFNIAPSNMYSALEVPYLLLGGIIIGCLAAGYIQLIQAFARLSETPFWQRMILAGSLTALVGVFLPQVMGVGYDTVNQIMLSEISIVLLIALLFAKALTSAAAVGLGMPVGLIGPSLMLGAAVGGIFGNALISWQGADISIGLYVVLGMCAMMAAVLRAPLAALMAVMEMTANTSIIMPAMVIIVVATLVTSQLFGQQSVFITTLNTLGLQYPPNPITLHLQRVGVTAIMDRSFVRLPETITALRAREVLQDKPHWILVDDAADKFRALLNPADLLAFIEARAEDLKQQIEPEQVQVELLLNRSEAAQSSASDSPDDSAQENAQADPDNYEIRLLELPGQRMDVTTLTAQSTVAQVQQALSKTQAEACCITRTTAPMIAPVIGVVTQSHIDNYRKTTE